MLTVINNKHDISANISIFNGNRINEGNDHDNNDHGNQ